MGTDQWDIVSRMMYSVANLLLDCLILIYVAGVVRCDRYPYISTPVGTYCSELCLGLWVNPLDRKKYAPTEVNWVKSFSSILRWYIFGESDCIVYNMFTPLISIGNKCSNYAMSGIAGRSWAKSILDKSLIEKFL